MLLNMNLKIIIVSSLLTLTATAICQTEPDINKTDSQGRKQGHWIKKYPNDSVLYDGFFRNNNPVGEFRRYYENKTLKSLLVYNEDGTGAEATMYYTNGNVSSKGKYINRMKQGKWQFFSELIKGCLISEEHYSLNVRDGVSLKFYMDSTVAEKITYVKGIRQGEWIKYYPSGKVSLKSNFLDDKINGRFEVWFESGTIQFSGQYKNDKRDGVWYIYSNNGTLRYTLEYVEGVTKDKQMDIDESDQLDLLEKNKGKIDDPEKTGVIW